MRKTQIDGHALLGQDTGVEKNQQLLFIGFHYVLALYLLPELNQFHLLFFNVWVNITLLQAVLVW